MSIPPPSRAPTPELSLHTSWRGLIGAVFTPIALLGLGGLALRDGGLRTVPLLLATLGAALILIALLDYPHRVTIGRSGITRHALLRQHVLTWDRIVALERTRPATGTVVRNMTDRQGERQVSGGLVARGRGRRRWLLTDRIESRAEYDHLTRLLRDLDGPLELRAARPHPEAAPTFLYRRRGPRGHSA
jgi:hypothetical protein